MPPAWQLYDWLIRPLEAALQDVNIDTLVFVPDGPLRTIPMAALHDREQFLVEKYALAISPGLTFTEPQPLPRDNAQLLVAGLTEVVQGFPPLPYVAQEIAAMENLYANHQSLVNEGYLKTRFQERLREDPYTIVHIASHGEFNSRAEDTFILTYDSKLTLDQLDQMVGLLRLRDEPIELLTLSACQTAVGDDRAALGLAGIAVKAGVRSALATLWYINDEASIPGRAVRVTCGSTRNRGRLAVYKNSKHRAALKLSLTYYVRRECRNQAVASAVAARLLGRVSPPGRSLSGGGLQRGAMVPLDRTGSDAWRLSLGSVSYFSSWSYSPGLSCRGS